MKQLTTCCGIDYENCEAFLATVNNDNELHKKDAQKRQEIGNASDTVAESINCAGYRADGMNSHCNECEILNCAKTKGFDTCSECKELDTCQIIGPVLQHYMSEAKENLPSD